MTNGVAAGRSGANRPFRFAAQSYATDNATAWRATARRTEDLGYSTLHLADHYIGPGPAIKATNHPVQSIAAVPAMAVAAEVTTTLRIGCRVFCVDYHHPVVLAKELATLDVLSEGRIRGWPGRGLIGGRVRGHGHPLRECRRTDRTLGRRRRSVA